ncbi:MAG: phospholipase [Acidobacteria bacterium]|nr:MAG: phospholipase [Acidobacteriota bacterium]
MKINRRDFLRSAAGASGALLLGRAAWPALHAFGVPRDVTLPPPSRSGIEHIVVVMMENRSFDHLLGWLPNAHGKQEGLTYVDAAGFAHQTHPLAPDYTGCKHPDPDHSYDGGRVQYNDGRMDGFLRSGSNDDYAIGYYVEADLPFSSALARNYTTLEHYFCSILGPTFPNRIFLHAAQTDRLGNTAQLAKVPTIWDRLAAKKVSARYYFSNVPFLGLWGTKYLPISRDYSAFLLDASLGQLPAVSFIDPRFTVFDDGTGNDDHPHADVRAGDAFLAETFHAVATSPVWPSTVFIVTFDEWGGFFDHIAPPRAAAANAVDPDIVDGKTLLGFRVPVIVASPFSRGDAPNPRVNSLVFDHTSILKLIEWRWKLAPLTPRDASDDIQNLAYALQFDQPNAEILDLPQPLPPEPQPCPNIAFATDSDWWNLIKAGMLRGWPVAIP